jgi:hypothetical protein
MPKRLALIIVLLGGGAVAVPSAENWPQWRGPSLNGLSGEHNLPIRWSTTDNIAWKLALPAFSASTPIVWGDRIFLNIADSGDLYDFDDYTLSSPAISEGQIFIRTTKFLYSIGTRTPEPKG